MRLLLVSDTHLGPATDVFEPNWRAVRRFAADGGVDVTVHLGDISLDGANEVTQLDYAHAATGDWPTPIHVVPGNHDVGDNPWAPGMVNLHPLKRERLIAYRSRFGADYWLLESDDWWVIGLNAQLFGSGTSEESQQWAWLAECVARAECRPTAMVIHKPLFQNDADDAAPHIRYVPYGPRRRLLGLLAPFDARVVANGHTHQYLDRMIGGVRHVWVPSSAFVFPDAGQERIGRKVTGVGLLELTFGVWLRPVSPDQPSGDLEWLDQLTRPLVHVSLGTVFNKRARSLFDVRARGRRDGRSERRCDGRRGSRP